jgi:hypothetical protein
MASIAEIMLERDRGAGSGRVDQSPAETGAAAFTRAAALGNPFAVAPEAEEELAPAAQAPAQEAGFLESPAGRGLSFALIATGIGAPIGLALLKTGEAEARQRAGQQVRLLRSQAAQTVADAAAQGIPAHVAVQRLITSPSFVQMVAEDPEGTNDLLEITKGAAAPTPNPSPPPLAPPSATATP